MVTIQDQRRRHILPIRQAGHVCVASALLGLIPLKPRTIASLGILTSCLSMYSLAPAVAPPAAKAKPA
eukprot:904095-Prorocentrum_minimum.AAC.2